MPKTLNEIYILYVDEDAPTVHPVAFATLKAAQDYCERWQGQHMDWQIDTDFTAGIYLWRAKPNGEDQFPFYTIEAHKIQYGSEE